MAEANIHPNATGPWMVGGELSFQTVSLLERQSRDLFAKTDQTEIVVDLKGVERADSAGIALLLEWIRITRQFNKKIAFSHVPNQMQNIIELCDLKDQLPIITD